MAKFTNYEDWHRTITGVCRIELTRAYCKERREALADEEERTTQSFITAYGRGYRDLVSGWFLRAEEEAES